MILCDTHADTLHVLGNESTKPVISTDTLKQGGVSLQVLALWTGRDGNRGDVEGIVSRELAAYDAWQIKKITDLKDVCEGETAVMLSIEGGEVFEGDVASVDAYSARGVRMAALLWNNENSLGHPAKSGSTKGLTEHGLNVVKRMQKMHMAVDTSHLNEQGFYDIFLKTHCPPLASHSCCKALCDHFRNLTDAQIKLMITCGGYIGVNFYPYFLNKAGASITDVVNHIDHICQLGGEKFVGFGSDFDGIEVTPEGLCGPEDFPKLLQTLKTRGYDDATVERIAGKNLLDYFTRIA